MAFSVEFRSTFRASAHGQSHGDLRLMILVLWLLVRSQAQECNGVVDLDNIGPSLKVSSYITYIVYYMI